MIIPTHFQEIERASDLEKMELIYEDIGGQGE